MNYQSKYVIDFKRLNEITTHPNDNPSASASSYGGPSYCYSITRGLIKEYMRIYMEHLSSRITISEEKINEAIEVLYWNGILVSPTEEIRDRKIEDIVK